MHYGRSPNTATPFGVPTNTLPFTTIGVMNLFPAPNWSREFAAWLGLLPNQHSTGGKARLGAISKRGNCYLRTILIHGARAVVFRSKRDRIAWGAWMTSLESRAPRNVLIVATAHKLARIAWAVLSTGQDYRAAVPEALAA